MIYYLLFFHLMLPVFLNTSLVIISPSVLCHLQQLYLDSSAY